MPPVLSNFTLFILSSDTFGDSMVVLLLLTFFTCRYFSRIFSEFINEGSSEALCYLFYYSTSNIYSECFLLITSGFYFSVCAMLSLSFSVFDILVCYFCKICFSISAFFFAISNICFSIFFNLYLYIPIFDSV